MPPRHRKQRMAVLIAVHLTAAMLWASAAQAEELYSFGESNGNGQLYRIDVDSGKTTAIGPVRPASPRILTLATHSDDGQLYGLASENGFVVLYRIDPETSSIAMVGSPEADGGGISDLSLTPYSSSLLVTDGSAFYFVDPVTGFSSPWVFLPRSVEALVSRDDRLYAITEDGSQEGLYRIEELDWFSVTLTTLSTFELDDEEILDAAFDAHGRLRLVTIGGGIPELVNLSYFRIDDLAAAQPVQTFSDGFFFTDIRAGAQTLAELPAGAVVDIPTADGLGKTLLAFALLAAALAFLRRP